LSEVKLVDTKTSQKECEECCNYFIFHMTRVALRSSFIKLPLRRCFGKTLLDSESRDLQLQYTLQYFVYPRVPSLALQFTLSLCSQNT
jgi:hypothetical protein